MKELKELSPTYLEEYDVHVTPYLTYNQIQAIVDAVKNIDEWAERQMNIDMLTILYATDIPQKELEANIDLVMSSGLADKVINCVMNYVCIYDALKYTQSVERALGQIVKKLPENYKEVLKELKKNGVHK